VDPKKSVFVENIPKEMDRNSLSLIFEECGEREVVLLLNKDGTHRRKAFINFEKSKSASIALDLNGILLYNSKLRVSKYSKK